MQQLDLNLASRPFRNNTLLWVGIATAVIALAAFTAWNITTYREHSLLLGDLRGQVVTFDARTAELNQREADALRGIRSFDLGSLSVQAEKANQVIAWKSFSWTRLFNLLESIQPWEVRMNSIRPIFRARDEETALAGDDKSVVVSVEGTAKTFDAFTELEQVLQQTPEFGRVEPVNLKRSKQGDILFQLRFLYRHAARQPDPPPADSAAGDGGAPQVDGEAVDGAGADAAGHGGGASGAATQPPPASRGTAEAATDAGVVLSGAAEAGR